MKIFFKSFLASLLALFVFTALGFFLLIGIAAAFSTDEPKTIADNSILVIDLSVNYLEQTKSDPYTELINKKKGKTPNLSELVQFIQYAKTDASIKGIYLKCQQNPNGYGASEEINKALMDFKQSKKFIVAYGETITQKGYLIGSIADAIYTHPQGGLAFNGFSYESMFFKGLLDKLDIEPQVFYAGKFKSATEPFRFTEMSAANKLQTSAWLNGIYNQFLESVSTNRKLKKSILFELANEGKVQTAFDALKYHLVDGLLYDDQLKKVLAKKMHLAKELNLSFTSINDYANARAIRGSGAGKIAVLFANGDIVMGKDLQESIASDDFRVLIQKIRNDQSIKGVVLRVNSPGGSSLASDIIWREIDLLKKEKPVVVSMGDLAASGGYYIACGADSIFANAGTITGSIGVFSILPNMKGFMNNKLGISMDGVKTGKFADMPSALRPLNAVEQKFLQAGVDSIYFTFKSRVAQGRKKSIEYIDSIAQGRVWTGEDAIKIGLVDKIGTLEDAVKAVAKMAHLKGYSLKTYPKPQSFIEAFLGNYEEEISNKAIANKIGMEQWSILQEMKSIKQMMGEPQARLPIFVSQYP